MIAYKKNCLAAICLLFVANVQAQPLGLNAVVRALRNGGSEFYRVARSKAFGRYFTAEGVQKEIQRIREVKPALAQEIDDVIRVLAERKKIPHQGTVERLAGELENISNARNKQEVLKFLDRSSDDEARVMANDIREGRLVLVSPGIVRLALKKDVYSRDEILKFFANRSEDEYFPVLIEEETFMLSTLEGYERLLDFLRWRAVRRKVGNP